jgi:hypothetical protein
MTYGIYAIPARPAAAAYRHECPPFDACDLAAAAAAADAFALQSGTQFYAVEVRDIEGTTRYRLDRHWDNRWVRMPFVVAAS